MRLLAVLALIGVIATPVAAAKMGIKLALSDASPIVGQAIAVKLTTERPLSKYELKYGLRVVAVAPRASCAAPVRSGSISSLNRCERTHMYAVISKAVSGGRLSVAKGWLVSMTQSGPTTWTETVTFTRPGRWLLVVPNGPTVGYSIPPPVVRAVPVRSA